MKLWKVLGTLSMIVCAVLIYITRVLEFPVGSFTGITAFLGSIFSTVFLEWPSLLTSSLPFAEEGVFQILYFALYLAYSYAVGALLGVVISKSIHALRPSRSAGSPVQRYHSRNLSHNKRTRKKARMHRRVA